MEIYAAKPGVIVGKDGQNLKNLYKKLEKILKPLFPTTTTTLILQGLGYSAEVKGKEIYFKLGFRIQ